MSPIDRKIQEIREAAAQSIDGFKRSRDAEERINSACRALFASENGKVVMEYLRSITTNVVMPATASDAELRDREGMRRLVGILDARAKSNPKE